MKISIASGKGGTGKTLVATSMAVLPQTVLLFSELCHGCGGCTIICPERAVSETYRSVGEIFRALSGGLEIIWGELALGEAPTFAFWSPSPRPSAFMIWTSPCECWRR
jgi:MinD superfamily P-loop ATPase